MIAAHTPHISSTARATRRSRAGTCLASCRPAGAACRTRPPPTLPASQVRLGAAGLSWGVGAAPSFGWKRFACCDDLITRQPSAAALQLRGAQPRAHDSTTQPRATTHSMRHPPPPAQAATCRCAFASAPARRASSCCPRAAASRRPARRMTSSTCSRSRAATCTSGCRRSCSYP